jgi:hypothetical protein
MTSIDIRGKKTGGYLAYPPPEALLPSPHRSRDPQRQAPREALQARRRRGLFLLVSSGWAARAFRGSPASPGRPRGVRSPSASPASIPARPSTAPFIRATYRLRAYRSPPPREGRGGRGRGAAPRGLAEVGEDARDRSAMHKIHSLIFSSFPPAEAAEAARTPGSGFPSGRRYGYLSKDSSAISCILSWRKISGSWCLS